MMAHGCKGWIERDLACNSDQKKGVGCRTRVGRRCKTKPGLHELLRVEVLKRIGSWDGFWGLVDNKLWDKTRDKRVGNVHLNNVLQELLWVVGEVVSGFIILAFVPNADFARETW